MRLGTSRCRLKKSSRAFAVYQAQDIHERHRHRYEFNNAYRDQFEHAGLVISGTFHPLDRVAPPGASDRATLDGSGDLVELIELHDHPWFMAGQFHPEFRSRPLAPHPLFRAFVEAGLKRAGMKRVGARRVGRPATDRKR